LAVPTAKQDDYRESLDLRFTINDERMFPLFIATILGW
jgi:hypothetical protein